MLDFGTSGSHSKRIRWPDRDALDALSAYTLGIKIQPRVSGWTTEREIYSKFNLGLGQGLLLQTINSAGNNRVRVLHNASSPAFNNTNLIAGTTYSLVVTWSGTVQAFSLDDVADGGGALTTAIPANANDIVIGNMDGASRGSQVAVGHVMFWPIVLNASQISQYHGGVVIPAASYLALYHRGVELPGKDEIAREIAQQDGTPALLADDVDAMFPINRQIENERTLATQALLERLADESKNVLRVPLHLGERIELLDLFNVSEDTLLRSASHLASFDDQLMTNWRRGLYMCVGKVTYWKERESDLAFVEHELAMASFFASFRAPYGTADDYPGVAMTDLGGIIQEERTSKAYLVQENDQVVEDGAGNFVAAVGPNRAKINHLGLLAEDGVANKITDPVFANGLTSYSATTAGGGTVAAVTNRLALPDTVTTKSIEVVGAVGAYNYFTPASAFAVLASEGYARVCFIWSDRQNTNPNWGLQRSTDSQWWNDASEAFGASEVVNGTNEAAYDAVNSLEVVKVFWSKPIPITNDETWTVKIGKSNTATLHNFYLLNVVPGKLRKSPLIDTGTPDDDTFTDELDTTSPVRQLLPVDRFTVAVDLVAFQDGADYQDGEQSAIWTAQVDNTGNNFYALLYQKLSGQNARFSFERWASGSLDVRATFDVALIFGESYRVVCRQVGDTQELGLTAKTMRIQVREGVSGTPTNGTDVVASALFSSSQGYTKLWFGSGPSGAGFLRGSNYLSLVRVLPRVITDEELGSVL